jgi:hypothetical protein
LLNWLGRMQGALPEPAIAWSKITAVFSPQYHSTLDKNGAHRNGCPNYELLLTLLFGNSYWVISIVDEALNLMYF